MVGESLAAWASANNRNCSKMSSVMVVNAATVVSPRITNSSEVNL